MSMFSDGFLTGFMGNTAQNIKKKKDEADLFFQEQMQLARTRGMKNRDLTNQIVNGHIQVAKQLEQMGVPKDLVMSIAKQNPDDMPAVMETIQKLQKDGVTPDEAFYRDLIKTSGDFKAPDEDMSTFITSLYGPLSANIKADKAAFNDDPVGGLWATMMGTNAMDMASQRLEDTIIMDGMSAADLLRYSDQPQPNTVGAPTVNIDYGIVGNAEREAADRLAGPDQLKITEITALNTAFDEAYSQAQMAISKEWSEAHPNDTETDFADIPNAEQAAISMAVEALREQGYSDEYLLQIPKIAAAYGVETEEENPEEDAAEGSIQEPPTEVTTPKADTSEIAPEIPDVSSAPQVPSVEGDVIETPENFPKTLANGAVLVSVHSDGTSDWRYPDGVIMTHSNEEIIKSVTDLYPADIKRPRPLNR